VVRLPSAIAFAINIALVALVTYRLQLGLTTALLAGVLIALSPLHVWYAQEARMYALVMTTTLLFSLGLLLNSWIGAIVATTALTTGLYLDFTTVPLAAALLAVWSVWWWHHGRNLVDLLRTVLVVGTSAFLARPVWRQLTDLLAQLDQVTVFAKLRGIVGVEHIPSEAFLMMLGLTTVAFAATTALLLRLSRSPAIVSVAQRWVPLGFLMLIVVSVIPRGYSVKHLIAVGWPFVTILVAWLLNASASRRVLLPTTTVVCAIAAVATVATPRADWRGAVEHIDRHHVPGDLVWLDPSSNVIPYNYYQPQIVAETPGRALARASEALPVDTGLWLVAERFGSAPPTSPTEEWLDSQMTLTASQRFARLELRRYARSVTK
jgi:uncharacterized membrane protein